MPHTKHPKRPPKQNGREPSKYDKDGNRIPFAERMAKADKHWKRK